MGYGRVDTKKLEVLLTLFTFAILASLGLKYLVSSRVGMVFDIVLSLIGLGIFLKLYDSLGQDIISYFFFAFVLVLHNLGLYAASPFGIRFDHYMHFVGGFAIAMMADRAFTQQFSMMKRFVFLVIFTLGIGSIGEIIEWLGYAFLGSGEGFLFYGMGDEGEWRNAMLDLIFDLLGGAAMAALGLFAEYAPASLSNKYKKEFPTKD